LAFLENSAKLAQACQAQPAMQERETMLQAASTANTSSVTVSTAIVPSITSASVTSSMSI